jgi:hypothetical protein
MNWMRLLMMALLGWTALGVLGVLLSLARRERQKVVSGVSWIAGIWLVYVAVLATVSARQPQRVVGLGQEQCFGDMCFAVKKVEELPRFLGVNGLGDGSRLVRVTVEVKNKGKGDAESDDLLRAYLIDAQGRRWVESKGVSGNRLTGRVAAGDEMLSEPVFKLPADATGLRLVFTHGRWQPGVLVIGDSDSWWHKRTVVPLGI